MTFSSVLHAKAWLDATKGSDAPVNDIQLYKDLGALAQISGFSVAAHKAHKVLNRHSCYLTEEVSVFSLFSDKLFANEKTKIALELKNVGKPLAINFGKPTLLFSQVKSELSSYIGKRSWLLFHNLNNNG